MIVEGTELAAELRRRRLGRAGLQASLTQTSDSAWVPGAQLADAPSELLMLAAISLAEPVTGPMQGTSSGQFFTGAPPGRSASA